MQANQQLTFDRYRVDLPNAQLWRGNRRMALTNKAFAVLRYLVEYAGQVVTKAELFDALWTDTVVSDGALTFCIVELRKALGDNAKHPKFIETVHGRGYRFIEKVVSSQQSVVSSQEEERQKAKIENFLPAPRPQHPASTVVGREAALAQLHHWLDKALNGERQIVFVTGEPGIGKTTLVEKFLFGVRSHEKFSVYPIPSETSNSELPSTPGMWVAMGQCIEHYGSGEPYMPILEALGRLCREPDGEQLVTLLTQHAPTWLVQMPSLLNPTELEALQRKTQGATRERMLREMGEALEAITAERPLVLWLEDLHWSDTSTLELLSVLARRREPARLLVIGTYRPVDVIVQEHPLRTVKQELQLHGLCAELPLGLLSEAQVAEYLAVRFDADVGATGRSPLQSMAQAIHRRTDGNPLFMVTLVDDLVSQRVPTSEAHVETRHVASLLDTIQTTIPATLQQLITQQIERLSTHDRHLLEVASVTGMEFSAAAVAAGLAMEVETVEERCEALAQHGRFLQASGAADWPDGTVAAQYSFLHALYQEVLYHRIPAGRRQRLHQRIGERQEQAYGKRAREIAAELALHFDQGHDYARAVRYLQQAGENALQRSAYQEAVAHFTRGLQLLNTMPDMPERVRYDIQLRLALAPSLIATRSFAAPEVEQTYTQALALCEHTGNTPQRIPVLRGLCVFYYVRGELQKAWELQEQFLRSAQSERDAVHLPIAHMARGNTALWRGNLVDAHAYLGQALALYDLPPYKTQELSPLEDVRAVCRYHLAFTLWSLGYPEQALQQIPVALALAQELGAPFGEAGAFHAAAFHHQLRQEASAAQERIEVSLAIAREHGLPWWEAASRIVYGWALSEQGTIAEGINQIRQGMAGYLRTGAQLVQSYHLTLFAGACGKAGQGEEALTALAEALVQVEHRGERFYEAEIYRLKGEITLQSSNQRLDSRVKEAEACFLRAIAIATKQHAKSLELRATMSLARLWQQQGKKTEAHKLLSEIYQWFTEGFDTKDLREAKALLIELQH